VVRRSSFPVLTSVSVEVKNQKKYGRAEELLRGKRLRRVGDGRGHRLSLPG